MNKELEEAILYHYKHPKSKRVIKDATKLTGSNQSCGDKLNLYIKIQDNKISAVSFDGSMCAICNYGAELLTAKIKGLDLKDAQKIDSLALLGTNNPILNNPIRLKCFELAQIVLKTSFDKDMPKK